MRPACRPQVLPPIDLRDEWTLALLLACETGQARRPVAQHADVLAAERRTRFRSTVF
ncbi:hypothetical protein GCM10010255_83430 [Streptomyces coeruleofuscus]|uniref:CHAT domain-containing protein n=1 Tax=Streptomyces coeruleofuscus TaxID=66879 RepID=A0ABP5WI83_9ACTN